MQLINICSGYFTDSINFDKFSYNPQNRFK